MRLGHLVALLSIGGASQALGQNVPGLPPSTGAMGMSNYGPAPKLPPLPAPGGSTQASTSAATVLTTRPPAGQTASSGGASRVVASGGGAEIVPAISETVFPPAMNTRPVALSPSETRAVAVARDWREKSTTTATGAAGAVTWAFGAALPSLVCAPLYVCTIKLQPGELVNDIHVGDKVRWIVTPATAGAGERKTTLVVVKPTDAGLESNLSVTTDRRQYSIKLISTQRDWMPQIEFSYPEEADAQWASYMRAQESSKTSNTMRDTGQDVSKLDFDFKLGGDRPAWLPLRVYSDGRQTFIKFPRSMKYDEAPVLVALDGSGDNQLVNYRVKDDTFIVDKALRRAALMSGVGSGQERVTITHSGS